MKGDLVSKLIEEKPPDKLISLSTSEIIKQTVKKKKK